MRQPPCFGRVYVLAKESPPARIFIDTLSRKTGCQVILLSDGIDKIPKPSERELYMVDICHGKGKMLPGWLEDVSQREYAQVAAYNLDDIPQAFEVLSQIQFDGFFFREESMDTLCKGILVMLSGEKWMPRRVMSGLINYYRKRLNSNFNAECGLTSREMDMISLLKLGLSNQKMAEKLCVSEHTVKSHLHNIYKKINVSNRAQALNWVHQNSWPALTEESVTRLTS